jgi:hypothetical protein
MYAPLRLLTGYPSAILLKPTSRPTLLHLFPDLAENFAVMPI